MLLCNYFKNQGIIRSTPMSTNIPAESRESHSWRIFPHRPTRLPTSSPAQSRTSWEAPQRRGISAAPPPTAAHNQAEKESIDRAAPIQTASRRSTELDLSPSQAAGSRIISAVLPSGVCASGEAALPFFSSTNAPTAV